MKVFILKEGKEYNQGVAYLDDGTMVVVDNARKMISKTIDIVVTSVLQTTAGKMIFGRYSSPAACRRRRAASHASTGTSQAVDAAVAHRRLKERLRFLVFSLVSHGLLDSDHRDLHDRAGHRLDHLELLRSPRPLRASLRAGLVMADSRDDGR